jgi:hypothetical protein
LNMEQKCSFFDQLCFFIALRRDSDPCQSYSKWTDYSVER